MPTMIEPPFSLRSRVEVIGHRIVGEVVGLVYRGPGQWWVEFCYWHEGSRIVDLIPACELTLAVERERTSAL